MLNEEEKKLVDMIVSVYVNVMGSEKWESLTAQEQHDVVMTIVKDMTSFLEYLQHFNCQF